LVTYRLNQFSNFLIALKTFLSDLFPSSLLSFVAFSVNFIYQHQSAAQ
jgi:hypothetical protein